MKNLLKRLTAIIATLLVTVSVISFCVSMRSPVYADGGSLTVRVGYMGQGNYEEVKTYSEEELKALGTVQQYFSYFNQASKYGVAFNSPVRQIATGIPLEKIITGAGIDIGSVQRCYFRAKDGYTGIGDKTADYLFGRARYYYPHLTDKDYWTGFTHKVSFCVDPNLNVPERGDEIAEIVVERGRDAVPPEPTLIECYAFTGWTGNYKNVIDDETVIAHYKRTGYKVSFCVDPNLNVAEKGKEIARIIVERGRDAKPPEPLVIEGYTFTGWTGNYKNVNKDETVTAHYKKNDVSAGSVVKLSANTAFRHSGLVPESKQDFVSATDIAKSEFAGSSAYRTDTASLTASRSELTGSSAYRANAPVPKPGPNIGADAVRVTTVLAISQYGEPWGAPYEDLSPKETTKDCYRLCFGMPNPYSGHDKTDAENGGYYDSIKWINAIDVQLVGSPPKDPDKKPEDEKQVGADKSNKDKGKEDGKEIDKEKDKGNSEIGAKTEKPEKKTVTAKTVPVKPSQKKEIKAIDKSVISKTLSGAKPVKLDIKGDGGDTPWHIFEVSEESEQYAPPANPEQKEAPLIVFGFAGFAFVLGAFRSMLLYYPRIWPFGAKILSGVK